MCRVFDSTTFPIKWDWEYIYPGTRKGTEIVTSCHYTVPDLHSEGNILFWVVIDMAEESLKENILIVMTIDFTSTIKIGKAFTENDIYTRWCLCRLTK